MSELTLPPLPERDAEAHKGSCGRLLVIAGSRGMTGAGCMVSLAALRTGAGLVTWALPESLNIVAETAAMEILSLPLPETEHHSPSVDAREMLLEAAMEADAVVLGPGLPVAGETGELIRLLTPEIHAPLLLDAGALTAIGRDPKPIRTRKQATIVTPHPGEMMRLTGKDVETIQAAREETAREYADASGAVVVLKGAGTVITDGTRTRINESGNPGMATAGTGDVLAGVVAALLGQGLEAPDAAALGVHLHGRSGDIAAETRGTHGLIARDLIEALPAALLRYTGGA